MKRSKEIKLESLTAMLIIVGALRTIPKRQTKGIENSKKNRDDCIAKTWKTREISGYLLSLVLPL